MRRRGMAIAIVLQVLTLVLIVALGFMTMTDTNSNFVRQERRSMQALSNAQAGANVVLKQLCDKLNGATVSDASGIYAVVDGYQSRPAVTGSVTTGSDSFGTYSVTCTVVPAPSASPLTDDPRFITYKNVTMTSVGSAYGMNRTLQVTVKAGLKPPSSDPSNPFSYASYINNYWYLGSLGVDLTINGNLGANGWAELLGASNALVNGNPVYDAAGNVLSSGGQFSALAFTAKSTGTWQGYGTSNRHESAAFIKMPSLGNVTYYMNLAKSGAGSVMKNGVKLIDKVVGDSGSTPNVLLEGTSGQPLAFSGVTTVKGDVIIKGTISGTGTLYVGRNLYVAGDVTYKNHYTARPSFVVGSDTAQTYWTKLQTWMTTNASNDCVTFCVAGNVVLNDVTYNNTAQSKTWWDGIWPPSGPSMTSYVNRTAYGQKFADLHEDGGFDKIWGSTDTGEADNKWTVLVDNGTTVQSSTFTLSGSPLAASIPNGTTVIPGSGEDVDGDGRYTPATTLNNFLFVDQNGNPTRAIAAPPAAATSEVFLNWPVGKTYQQYLFTSGDMTAQTNWPTHFDGFYFCNHLIAGYYGNGSSDIQFHGGYATRQMTAGIYQTAGHKIVIEHDDRIDHTDSILRTLPGVAGFEVTQWTEQ